MASSFPCWYKHSQSSVLPGINDSDAGKATSRGEMAALLRTGETVIVLSSIRGMLSVRPPSKASTAPTPGAEVYHWGVS